MLSLLSDVIKLGYFVQESEVLIGILEEPGKLEGHGAQFLLKSFDILDCNFASVEGTEVDGVSGAQKDNCPFEIHLIFAHPTRTRCVY